MSKIEEMADAYGRENPFTWYDADAEINENTSLPAIAYSDGANAVLKEIEKVFDISKPYLGNPFATLEERARGVYDLVKELKGE